MIWIAVALAADAWQWRGPPLPEDPSWRDARAPFDQVVAHAATVDRDGQLLLATVEHPEGASDVVRLNAWDGSMWQERLAIPTRTGERVATSNFDLATAGRSAWLAWTTADRTIEVASDAGGRWTLPWPPSTYPTALAVVPGEAAVVASFQRTEAPGKGLVELWFLPLQGGGTRLGSGDHVDVKRRWGRSAFTVYDYDRDDDVAMTWPPTEQRPPDPRTVIHAWLVPARKGVRWETYGDDIFAEPARGPGWPLVARGQLLFAGSHGNPDVNRVVVHRRLPGRLAPPGQPSLRIPQEQPHHDLLRTPTPTLVLPLEDGVGVLRWTGRTWWGLGHDPSPPGGLGDPERPSSKPWFSGGRLRWLEQDDDRGYVVMERSDSDTAREIHGVGRLQLLGRGGDLMWGRHCDDCSWDRMWGADYEPTLVQVATQELRSIPAPSAAQCGGDPDRQRCRFDALLATENGALLAAVGIASNHPWSWELPREPPRILRFDGNGWQLDASAAEDTSPYATAFLPPTQPPVAVFQWDDWERGTLHAGVQQRGTQGWVPLDAGEAALVRERPVEPLTYAFDEEVAGAIPRDGGLWLAWRQRLADAHARLAVAEHTDEGWVRREPSFPQGDVHHLALATDPEQHPVLAWSNDEGVHVWRYVDGWTPVGEGTIWRGTTQGLTMASVGDELCVAFVAPSAREDQIGLRCMPYGASQPAP